MARAVAAAAVAAAPALLQPASSELAYYCTRTLDIWIRLIFFVGFLEMKLSVCLQCGPKVCTQ